MNQLWQQPSIINHTQLLCASFRRWTGRELLSVTGDLEVQAKQLFDAPFMVVSHGVETDPIFNYGNRQALELWELSWWEFTQLPSRKSAEPMLREKRQELLEQVASQGFGTYSGVRISSTGKRFRIKEGLLWNLLDAQSRYCGQAATFSDVEYF
ncbi:MAG: MEKHLA domain-containing protein [Jaaginema sp. PMC 1080.18]|nr:MEKHLA domain-containing protein [Jaaginema sp. PMC 1080.18]